MWPDRTEYQPPSEPVNTLPTVRLGDFLRGAYPPVGVISPQRTEPSATPPVAGVLAYCADIRPAYAIVQYDDACRVHWVFGMFGDALSAEQYAIDSDLTRYDVVSATPAPDAHHHRPPTVETP